MKTVKKLVFAWFIMSAIFETVAIVLLAFRNSTFGVIVCSGILFLLLWVMVLVIRVLMDIQLIVESQKLIKP